VPVKPEPRTKPKPPARVEPPKKVEAPPPAPDPYRTVEPPRTAEVYKPYVPPTTVRPPRGTVADKAEVDRWLAKAKEAARAGHWQNALGAVKEVLDRDPNNQEGIAIGGLAACNARNAIAARNYLARLGGQNRALVRQVCVRNGLRVD
jgi:flavin-dependent dehydrogenase